VNGDRVLIYPSAYTVALALLPGGYLFLGVYLLSFKGRIPELAEQ